VWTTETYNSQVIPIPLEASLVTYPPNPPLLYRALSCSRGRSVTPQRYTLSVSPLVSSANALFVGGSMFLGHFFHEDLTTFLTIISLTL
jgi:hypothetical protein